MTIEAETGVTWPQATEGRQPWEPDEARSGISQRECSPADTVILAQ